MISALVRITRPGGWVESVESTAAHGGGPALDLWNSWGTALLARRGIDVTFAPNIGGLLVGAGLAQVSAREIPLPMGAYGPHSAVWIDPKARFLVGWMP